MSNTLEKFSRNVLQITLTPFMNEYLYMDTNSVNVQKYAQHNLCLVPVIGLSVFVSFFDTNSG